MQIPREQRSQIDRIHPLMIFKEKLVKKHGLKRILKPLVKDLKELEEGIYINFPIRRQVQLGVLVFSADNLEAHTLGGFSMCFSSKDICRFCHCQYDELEVRIHDNVEGESKHNYWSVREYDVICETFEEEDETEDDASTFETNIFYEQDSDEEYSDEQDSDEQDSDEEANEADNETDEEEEINKHGLRCRCPLNQLKSFHAILNFPPDMLHDIMEGAIAEDLFGILKIFVRKGYFSIQEYNIQMKRSGFLSYESSDRPQDVPEKGKKLSGKACSLWVHLRNFPLIVRSFINNFEEEDEVLLLVLKLLDVTNRLAAVQYRSHEIDELEEKVIEYLNMRKKVHETYPNLLKKSRHGRRWQCFSFAVIPQNLPLARSESTDLVDIRGGTNTLLSLTDIEVDITCLIMCSFMLSSFLNRKWNY